MAEPAVPEPLLPAARRSKKLAIAVVTLALLPLLLPFPLFNVELQWINPVADEQRQQCASYICPPATYWDSLGWLFVLGPSILLAVVAILLGALGLFRSRRHPTSRGNREYFWTSLTMGVVWAILFGGLLWFGITVLAGKTL